MSRRPNKIEEENQRLRNELKKLKSEISHLKKASNSIFPFEEKQKLALQVQDKLEQGIFSPPKLPIRPKSPLASHSRKTSKSPTFKQETPAFYEPDKENIPAPYEHPKAQNSSNKKILKISKTQYSDPLCSLNDTSRQNIDELQTLERENKMLKELNLLRKENEVLRSQIKFRTPKSVAGTKSKKGHLKGKMSFCELLDTSVLSVSRKSPKPNSKTQQKSAKKIGKNRIVSHKHSVSLIQKSPNKLRPSRSPSVCSRSPSSFCDNFSFTGSSKKNDRNRDFTDMPRTFNRSPSLTGVNMSPNVTPRSKNCYNCDHLLYKGLSTSYCGKNHEY